MIYSWKIIVRHGLPLLMFCLLIEIYAGGILQQNQTFLLQRLPIFLVSIPVINGVGGNIGSILGARLASGLHIGSINFNPKDKLMHENVITAIFLGICTYIALAIIIYFLGTFTGITKGIELIPYMSIFIGTGVFLICILSLVSVLSAFISLTRGIDPDDVVAPLVTTFGDTIGILVLFFFLGGTMI
jgi:mgtE-like transporter